MKATIDVRGIRHGARAHANARPDALGEAGDTVPTRLTSALRACPSTPADRCAELLSAEQIAALRAALSGRPLALCFGAGVDSTAMLLALRAADLRPDVITMADTGGEKSATWLHVDRMAPAHFNDRGRLFQADRGRRFSAIVDARGLRASEVFNVSQSSTISLKRGVDGLLSMRPQGAY